MEIIAQQPLIEHPLAPPPVESVCFAKRTLREMKSHSEKDPEMARKEMWAHFLAYNLIRQVMCQAATTFGLAPWTISFKGALQTLNAFALPLLTCAKSRMEELVEEMLLALARHEVGNRPGRLEPRRIKRRPKPHKLLNTPRSTARRLEVRDTYE